MERLTQMTQDQAVLTYLTEARMVRRVTEVTVLNTN